MLYDLSKLSAETRTQIEGSPKWRKFFSEIPKAMLRLDGNAKTVKGNARGFKTAILYLTPANGSGTNMCALAALALCIEPCLNTAGRGAMSNVQMARLRKTLFWVQYQTNAIAMIKRDIARFEAKALRVQVPDIGIVTVNHGKRQECFAIGKHALHDCTVPKHHCNAIAVRFRDVNILLES